MDADPHCGWRFRRQLLTMAACRCCRGHTACRSRSTTAMRAPAPTMAISRFTISTKSPPCRSKWPRETFLSSTPSFSTNRSTIVPPTDGRRWSITMVGQGRPTWRHPRSLRCRHASCTGCRLCVGRDDRAVSRLLNESGPKPPVRSCGQFFRRRSHRETRRIEIAAVVRIWKGFQPVGEDGEARFARRIGVRSRNGEVRDLTPLARRPHWNRHPDQRKFKSGSGGQGAMGLGNERL